MIGVVIVNYGSVDLLQKYAAQIGATTDLTFYVVDNFSSIQNRAAVRALCADHGWTPILQDNNTGFGAGCNTGFHRALIDGAEAVITLNPDVAITADALRRLGQRVLADPKQLVCPLLLRPDGSVWFNGAATSWQNGFTVPLGTPDSFFWLTGAVLAMSAAAMRELGGFVEDYFMYWEDLELSVRATRAGYELVVAEDISAVHEVSATHSGAAKSPLYIRTNCANRLRFIKQHGTAQQQREWLLSSAAYAKHVILRSGSRKYLLSPKMLWSSTAGTVQGARS